MKAMVPRREDAWRQGPFGIQEPEEETSTPVDPEEIDVILVPCVSFDRRGNRCGHGAGYYDRYLPRCTRAVKLGIAFSCQQTGKVPVGKWDWPLDAVVTEKGILTP
jgi:5-formyltetrahydrofolate cyclo-ligase